SWARNVRAGFIECPEAESAIIPQKHLRTQAGGLRGLGQQEGAKQEGVKQSVRRPRMCTVVAYVAELFSGCCNTRVVTSDRYAKRSDPYNKSGEAAARE